MLDMTVTASNCGLVQRSWTYARYRQHCYSLRRTPGLRWARNRLPSTEQASAECSCTQAPPAPFPDRSLAENIELPPLRDCKLYLNLTNGIEAIPRLQAHGLPFSFVRIQSTACEQQHFEKLMNELDADLLVHLALGRCCVVIDFGSRNKKRGASRALWLGTEFVRFALTRLWLDAPATAFLRGHAVAHTFERTVQGFSKSTKKRLRYFKRYLPPGGLKEVQLVGAYSSTQRDDDADFYSATLWAAMLPSGAHPELPASSSSGGALHQRPSAAGHAASSSSMQLEQQPVQQPGHQEQGQRQQQWQPGQEPWADISSEEREALLAGDCRLAVHRLLGLSLFLGGVGHAVLQRLEAAGSSVLSSDDP